MEGFPLPLRICFLADKILLVMDEIFKEKKIDEKEREVLREASQFFDQVRLGKEFVETLRVDISRVEASSLYGVVLDVLLTLKKEQKITDETEKILSEYRNTLDNTIKDPFSFNGSVKSLKRFRQFFVALRTISLDRIERPVEEVVIVGKVAFSF